MRRVWVLLIGAILFFSAAPSKKAADWSGVDGVFGRKGTLSGEVYKVTFPRTDLDVKVGDIPIEPGLALTSWMALEPAGRRAMAMGDLVVLPDELSPVISKLLDGGFDVTAVHNHLAGASPSIIYVHYHGSGDAAKLAGVVKDALAQTATPMGAPAPAAAPAAVPDWSKVEGILGWTGQHKGDLLQVSIPRAEKIREGGMEIAPAMGVAIAINFEPAGDKAAATGDFVLRAREVTPVAKALTAHGISVTALHTHLLNETPKLYFMHFWGVDDPEKLAQGLRAALDKVHTAKPK